MNNQENPDDVLNLTQAAGILKMSTPTLKKLALQERKITCTLFGRRIRFRRADLTKYITENTFHAQSQAE
jgi:excisionase family DNA binding protein